MSDSNRKAIVIGITGGIACGKSEVGRILDKMGFEICDADHVAHELMKAGTPVFQGVIDRFGAEILQENGEISRPALGKLIFGNPELRHVLNGLVHPAVRDALTEWIAKVRKNNRNAAVQIPLLYESGMESLDWDAVLCVSSLHKTVLRRLEARGMELDEAQLRIASQYPVEEKEQRSDYTIHNNGTLEELNNATRQAVKALSVERVL